MEGCFRFIGIVKNENGGEKDVLYKLWKAD